MYQIKDEENKLIGRPYEDMEEANKFAQEYVLTPLGAGQTVKVWWDDEMPLYYWCSKISEDGHVYNGGGGLIMHETKAGVVPTIQTMKMRKVDWHWNSGPNER